MPQTWNRYAYVANNPISFIDPDGMQEMRVGPLAYSGDPWFGGGFVPWNMWVDFGPANTLSMAGMYFYRDLAASQIGAYAMEMANDVAGIRNPITGMTAGEHWRVSAQGLAAFADGFIPFADPLSGYYTDGSVVGWQAGYIGGRATQEVATAAAAGQLIKGLDLFKNSTLFAKGTGLLNKNDYLRIGWGWRGSRLGGEPTFRIVTGGRNFLTSVPAWLRHMDFW